MRNYSEFELKMIGQLSNLDLMKSNVLDFIAESVLYDRGIEIKDVEKEISIWYTINDMVALSEIFEIISLLNYLEKNYLIFIHSNYLSFNNGNWISKNLRESELHSRVLEFNAQPIPTTIYDIITRYKSSYLIVGTEIKKFVENDFKSNEQILHEVSLRESKRQTRISMRSFYIALIALIFSFLSPLIFGEKEKKPDNQITSEQVISKSHK